MAEQKNPLGATGRTVASNVRRLREAARLSYAELERRLEDAGRKVPVLGLSSIERERRRVDADDLAALALALEVSPATLLMPDTESGDDTPAVTGAEPGAAAESVWQWLVAEGPLNLRVERTERSVSIDRAQYDTFRTTARPRWQRWIGAHPAQASAWRAATWVDLALRPGATEGGKGAGIADGLQEQVDELQHMVGLLRAGVDPAAGWQRPEERRGGR